MANDVYARIDAAVVQTIKDLGLNDIGERVHSQLFFDHDVTCPCVIVLEERLLSRHRGGDSGSNFVEFPVAVLIMDVISPRMHERKGFYLTCRETITDRFKRISSQDPLAGVPEVYGCLIDEQVTFDQKLPEYQKLIIGALLWFQAEKAR